ncbi:MAG: hypothetical protein Fur0010_05400 [Bdellovibrio sp.]
MFQTKKNIIVAVIGSLTLGLLMMKDLYRPYSKLWEENQSSSSISRLPAATNWSEIDIDLITDYFDYPTFGKLINQKIRTNFYTNKNERYLKEKSLKTIQEAFQKTFEHKRTEEKAAKLFTKNLYSEFIDNFIKTIQITKIVNGQFQFDFEFVPEINQKIEFTNELSTNDLIDIRNQESLLEIVDTPPKEITDEILDIPWPDSGDYYQYVGGNITAWFKVLDLIWKPSSPIPNPRKNAVKGFLRFRKYFKVNPQNSKLQLIKNRFFNIENIIFTKGDESNHTYVTVDVYKTFDLENLNPQLDRMEIYFGKLKPSNEIHDSILENLISKDKPDINTGDLILRGFYISDFDSQKKLQVQIKIKSLIYDFKSDELDEESKIIVSADGNRLPQSQMGLIKNEVRDRLLRMSSTELLKALETERFYPLDVKGDKK